MGIASLSLWLFIPVTLQILFGDCIMILWLLSPVTLQMLYGECNGLQKYFTAAQSCQAINIERNEYTSVYCRFASDVTAAMLVVKNKRVSLRWEMNSILMQILQKNFFCINHQHGRLVTWLQTKNIEHMNENNMIKPGGGVRSIHC